MGCSDYIESEKRAAAVHALMTRLLGCCPCESRAEVIRLYTADGLDPAEDVDLQTA